jgi:antitoxin (DNA-binding transcriptional repressor) of toxin-antitoxin stability system
LSNDSFGEPLIHFERGTFDSPGWHATDRPPGHRLALSTPCYDCPMDREVTQRQLRNDSGEIMRGLDRGETFVVTRNGVPVGELTPLRRHRFVSAEATIAMFRGAPSVELARLRADLDGVASQDPNPRA